MFQLVEGQYMIFKAVVTVMFRGDDMPVLKPPRLPFWLNTPFGVYPPHPSYLYKFWLPVVDFMM